MYANIIKNIECALKKCGKIDDDFELIFVLIVYNNFRGENIFFIRCIEEINS